MHLFNSALYGTLFLALIRLSTAEADSSNARVEISQAGRSLEKFSCSNLDQPIRILPSSIELGAGRLECAGMTLTWGPTRFRVDGPRILLDRTVIGTLTDREIRFRFARGDSTIEVAAERNPGRTLHWEQTIVDSSDSTRMTVIRADLAL